MEVPPFWSVVRGGSPAAEGDTASERAGAGGPCSWSVGRVVCGEGGHCPSV